MSSLPNYYLSAEEYLTIERKAEYKSEYVDGVMYAMAGSSERHNLIAGNIITDLNIQLRTIPCKVYPSDLKVRVPDSRKFFYPDVSVVCGETKFADDERELKIFGVPHHIRNGVKALAYSEGFFIHNFLEVPISRTPYRRSPDRDKNARLSSSPE